MSRKFEVGDRVIIDNLKEDTAAQRSCGISTSMRKAVGTSAVIKSISDAGNYVIYLGHELGGDWCFHPDWLRHDEPVKQEKQVTPKKIKVKIKPMEEILKTVDRHFKKGETVLLPKDFVLMGTEIKASVRVDADKDLIYINEEPWCKEWVTLPKSFIIPDKKIRKDLCSYEVNVQADELKVGCQTITKEQELLWFKVLGKRLGYEIKG